MEGVAGMMARLSHMQRVAAGGSAMYRTRVFFSFRVRATVATSPHSIVSSPLRSHFSVYVCVECGLTCVAVTTLITLCVCEEYDLYL